MPDPSRIIHIEPAAPTKPPLGAPCNGCGVCCLLEPCPLGIVLSGRRDGACVAVRWQASAGVYRCGAMTQAAEVLHGALPSWLAWLSTPLARLIQPMARRWIAAGQGCDSSVDVGEATPGSASTHAT